jgi:dTDP-4-dehydrorhamnose 3,5-epimerase
VNRLTIQDTPLAGLKLVERRRLSDERGELSRLFCASELAAAGWEKPVGQANLTLTRKKGTVRGLHFQNPPYAEMKLVMCLCGEVWDVVVDLRRDSATFLKSHEQKLSGDENTAVLIPEGFAHGFQTLTENCILLYFHSESYHPESEGGVNPLDPALRIAWPLPISEISPRDAAHPMLPS